MDWRSAPAAGLRHEAERRLRNKQAAPVEGLAKADVRALLHELPVHQIELKMQNEELQRIRALADMANQAQNREQASEHCLERVAMYFEEHLLSIAEDIQRCIAQDLHDDIGQELTGLALKANTLAEMIAPATTPAGKLAADIVSALDRTHEKVRGLGRGMLPFELEEGLLAGALQQLAAATSGSSRINCNFTCHHPDPVFDSRVSVHLYRIAQEAATNAVRHSGAQNVRISLDQENGESTLRIEDDGVGFSKQAAKAEGMGRRTMGYRAGLIGGKLEVGPGQSGGTQVVCRLAALTPQRKCGTSKEIGYEADGHSSSDRR